MDTLYRCIYTSTMTSSDPTGIPRILRTANRNNLDLGITSLLIFDGLHFCQYLEGPKNNLDELLRRIVADMRHTDVTIRGQGILDGGRRFPQSHIVFALTLNNDALDCFDEASNRSAFELLEALLPLLDMGRMSDN